MANEGYAALRDHSRVWKFAMGAKASKRRETELHLNPVEAIAAARGTARDIADRLINNHGGKSTDFRVAAIFSHPTKLGKIAKPVVFFDAPEISDDMKELTGARKHIEQKDVAVGFVVCILDRKSHKFIAHARPLLLDAASLGLLDSIVAKAAEVDEAGDLKDWRVS
jgi:hypothetical protein